MATQNIYSMVDTWNSAGTTFTGIGLNVTDTASASGSLLLDLQVGGVNKFKVNKAGNTTINASGVDLPALPSGTAAIQAGNQLRGFFFDTWAAGNTTVNGRVAEGTPSAPTATTSGRVLASMNGFGYGATGYVTGSKSQINLNTTETWTNTANGTNITFETTPTGSTSRAVSATFTNAMLTLSGNITTLGGTFLTTTSDLTNGAAAQVATMTNGPTAGNPTKWIPINDNGTTRYIPAW